MAKNMRLLAVAAFAATLNAHVGYGQTNPIVNPGFESWSGGYPTDWDYSGITYISQETNERYEGSSSVRYQIPATGTTVDLFQDIAITGTGVYTFSCQVLDNTAQGEVGLIINWRNAGGSIGYDNSSHSTDQAGWQGISINEPAPPLATIARVRIRGYKQNDQGGGFVYSDHAVFSGDTPLSVHLNYLEAVPVREGVEIRWATESEIETCGFLLYRSDMPDSNFNPITSALIPSRGESSGKTEYRFVDKTALSRSEYWYRLEEEDRNGNHVFLGTVRAVISKRDISAETHRLLGNFPNPFNPMTTVSFSVSSEKDRIRIEVFDAFGRKVRTLLNGFRQPGEYRIQWDGKDEQGMEIPSGVYFCRLENEEGTFQTGKMIKIK